MTPKIRIKGFTEEWTEVKLGEKGTFRSSGVDKKIYAGEKIINLLNYLDVYNMRNVDSLNCKQLMHVSASDRQIRECTVEKDDIFFTPTSETAEDIGHVMVISETLPNTCYSYHLMRYRPNHDVFYHTFPNWGFQTSFVRKQMFINAKGVQRMVLGLSEFEDTKVRIPSKSEQKAIANYFTTLENMIAGAEKQIASLSQTKVACLQSMFPQEGETAPRVRFKGFDGEWKLIALGDLFAERCESNIFGEMLSVTQNNGIIKASENGRRDTSNSDKSHYKVVKIGDIAYNSMRMWQGASGYSQYEGIVSPAYTVIAPIEGIDSLFFSYLFKTNSVVNTFRLHSQGLTSDTWNLKYPAFAKIQVCYPKKIQEQQKIATYFRSLDQQIDLQKKRLEKLRQIKAACLDNMFV